MSRERRSVRTLSYGLTDPRQLLQKLESDADKLGEKPHPYEVFNFIITAAVLAEWIINDYNTRQGPLVFAAPSKVGGDWSMPTQTEEWITNTSSMPNPEGGVLWHIGNMLSICAHTANASKHFHWSDGGKVESIGSDPPIADWYQYCFTSTSPDLYVTYAGVNYGLQEISGTLLQFYRGFLLHLEQGNSEGEA